MQKELSVWPVSIQTLLFIWTSCWTDIWFIGDCNIIITFDLLHWSRAVGHSNMIVPIYVIPILLSSMDKQLHPL